MKLDRHSAPAIAMVFTALLVVTLVFSAAGFWSPVSAERACHFRGLVVRAAPALAPPASLAAASPPCGRGTAAKRPDISRLR